MQRVKACINWVFGFMNKVSRDRVDVYSAQSSFYTIMGLIPFFMLILTLIQYTPLDKDDMMMLMGAIFPEAVHTYVNGIVASIYTKSSAMISGTVVAAVWACSRAMLSITNGLNTIYETNVRRNYIVARIRAAVFIVLLLLAVVMSAGLFVFGNLLHGMIIKYIPFLKSVSGMLVIFRNVATILMLTIMFCTIFTFLPYAKRRFADQLPGAAATAVSWSIFSYIFSIYIQYATGMSTIYGSLTTVVLMMLWLYFCMWLLFMGAEINRYLESPSSFS